MRFKRFFKEVERSSREYPKLIRTFYLCRAYFFIMVPSSKQFHSTQSSKSIKSRRCISLSSSSEVKCSLGVCEKVKMLEANKCNKSQKHRWKEVNENREEVTKFRSRNDENLHNNINNNNINLLLHRSCPNRSSIEIDSENLQQKQQQQLRRHSRSMNVGEMRRERANSRRFKLADWMTASCVKKLLPIFILVNMLPFLYAGESRAMNYHIMSYDLCTGKRLFTS